MGLLMTEPPNVAAAAASPHASVQESSPNTIACQRRVHGRGRWIAEAAVVQDPHLTDTISLGCLSRTDVECRADEGQSYRMVLADQFAETTHRTFDEPLRDPDGYPCWKRTDRSEERQVGKECRSRW